MKGKRRRLVVPLSFRSVLRRVWSGGQVGADIAGLRAAKKAGLETGGYIPLGFLTINGMRPEYREEFGLVETVQQGYPTRTIMNAAHTDGTIRFAYRWHSAGERLTLRAIERHGKPYLDITPGPGAIAPRKAAVWIVEQGIITLNVAGNADEHLEPFVETYLLEVFEILGWMGHLV
jgi:hypothetical protein